MLDEIGRSHNTDKASRYVKPDGVAEAGHDYLRHYEAHLSAFRQDSFTFLDLGVGFSPNAFASAKMWAEYFPGADVISVDVEEHPAPDNPQITFVRADLGSITDLVRLAREYRPRVVLDDASHVWPHQLLSLVYLLPSVQPGGVFIWEDIQTSSATFGHDYSMGYRCSPVDLGMMLLQKVALRDEPVAADSAGLHARSRTAYAAPIERDLVGAFGPVLDGLVALIDEITVLRRAIIIKRI